MKEKRKYKFPNYDRLLTREEWLSSDGGDKKAIVDKKKIKILTIKRKEVI
jgi:hypothetical protein